MNTHRIVVMAEEFATTAHAGQTRKYTDEPYITHCREVAELAARYGCGPSLIAAAWLHDTIEDTDTNRYTLFDAGFPMATVDAVCHLTDRYTADEYPGWNRATRKQYEADRLATGLPEEQTIKVCDLMSNTPSIVAHDPKFARTYVAEKRYLLRVLNRAHPQAIADAEAMIAAAEAELGLVP